jgi:glucose 1-dehydrogenase
MVNKSTNEKLPEVVKPCLDDLRILEGQKALVTGANSGIGESIALHLGKAGADVVVNYVVNEDAAQEVCEKIKKSGSNAIAIKADVSKEDQILAMYEQMFKAFGTIDILVSNAGVQRDSPLEKMTIEQWNAVIGINLTGQFLCAREAIKEFKRRGVKKDISCAAGKIVCMSSVHQMIPWAGHVNYASSKGGVHLLMESIAQEVAPYRIRVNSVAPGAIRTPINKSAWSTPEAYKSLMTLIPYKRIGEPEDIAHCVTWLVSDYADYITGTTIFVDGGMTLFPGFETGG